MLRAPNGKVLVVFLRSHGPYTLGSTAGFDYKEAARLVSIGSAEYKRSMDTKAHITARQKVAERIANTPPPKKVDDDNDQNEGEDEGEEDTVSVQTVDFKGAPKEVVDFFAMAGDDWKNANGNSLIAKAKLVTEDPVAKKADAIEVLEEYLGTLPQTEAAAEDSD